MSLEREGMPTWEPPCANGKPCLWDGYRGREDRCPHLNDKQVDFGTLGSLRVFWCANDSWWSLGDLDLFDEVAAREGRS